MSFYIDLMERRFRQASESMIDLIHHVYDPNRSVRKWKGRTFVIRKFSCKRKECQICGDKGLTVRIRVA